MNMLYYCNYMIFHKVQKGLDWLVFSILDNVCTRKFCKSNGYWKYVNNFKQMYNKSMWFSENKKKPPVKILSMADTGIILFICINSFTILINLLTILDAIAIKTDIEYIKDDEDENQCKVSLPDKYVIFEIKYFDSYDEFEEFRAILG